MNRICALFFLVCCAANTAQAVEPLRLQEGGVRVFSLTPYLAPHQENLGHIFAIRNAGDDVLSVHLRHRTSNNPFIFATPPQTPLRLIAANDEAFVAEPDTPHIVPFTIAPRDVQSFLLLGEYKPAHIYLWSPEYETHFLQSRQTMRKSLLVIMGLFLLGSAIIAARQRHLVYGGAVIIAALLFIIHLRLWGYWQAESSIWWLLFLLVALRGGLFYWNRQPLYILDASIIIGFAFWFAAAFHIGDAIQIYEIGNIILVLGGTTATAQILYALCQPTFMADRT